MRRKLLWFAIDLLAAALTLLAVWYFNYVIPQKGIQAVAAQNLTEDSGETIPGDLGSIQSTNIVKDTEDWHKKFADHFTDAVVATDTTYTSPDLSIELSYQQYDTGKLDMSDSGKHKKYGTAISYVLADIYVGDITCLQTAFAQDTYGIGYEEKLSSMSERMRALLAVNGDSYSNNRHKYNGTIIRNGVIYRNQPTDAQTCVLNWDGTMDIYEPGHYCLLLVDGRQDSSRGMFLEEMSQLFAQLGCKAAYNLDGGHCSFMIFQGKVANHPYKPEHEVADGIFITEGSK